MGRYATFETDNGDVVYKFLFGAQSCMDMTRFGGSEYRRFDIPSLEEELAEFKERMDEEAYKRAEYELDILKEYAGHNGEVYSLAVIRDSYWYDYGKHSHIWTQGDLNEVLEEVERIAKKNDCRLPDWDAYEADEEGVEQLTMDLEEACEDVPKAIVARFLLGCTIYLLLSKQECELTATYIC